MAAIFFLPIPLPIVFLSFFDILLVACLFFPILYGIKKDKYFIRLKGAYKIQLNFRGNSVKMKGKKVPTIGIYMVSNHLCNRWNKTGAQLIEEISRSRWLPLKGRLEFLFFTPFRYLLEYATVLNFESRFLNLALAIKKWDISYHNSFT